MTKQIYPGDRLEIIVSDNGSTDGSVEFISREYKNVRLLENRKNLGFALGNNVALEAARGDFLVLLNNDTAPEPGWLKSLVEVAVKYPDAGLVTGRTQLFYDQLTLTIQSENCGTLASGPLPSIHIFGIDHGLPGGTVQYLEGNWELRPQGRQSAVSRFHGRARIGVPVPRHDREYTIHFSLAADRMAEVPVAVKLFPDDITLDHWEISGAKPQNYSLTLLSGVRSRATPVIQNAGSLVFKNGAGRDRGTVVRDAIYFFEEDRGQFGSEEEVFAGCGANLLLRREMLREVGVFDPNFFMYYEDTDLSWRARLKGWKVFYAPQAIIRHIHCGTSQEWSPSFIFYTDRNRLAMLFKNGTWSSVTREWGGYGLRFLEGIFQLSRDLLRRGKTPHTPWAVSKIRSKVLFSLFCWLPRLVKERHFIQKTRSVSKAGIDRWLVPLSRS
ncbi:MAG: glycosyltransferase family 2 protein [Desulfobacterota bacterium]|nr:glycosyltransferase family 2 protein [Thermodesulfobacteriota bacterium]